MIQKIIEAAQKWREARRNIPDSKTPLDDMRKAEQELLDALSKEDK